MALEKFKTQFGRIFKDVTAEKSLPKNTVEVWNKVSKIKGERRPDLKVYGSNVTPVRGSVFKHLPYLKNLNKIIDQRLKE